MKSNEYWAERLYTQAIAAPDVDGSNWNEVEPYIRQLSEEVYLDPDEMVRITENVFMPITTDDFTRASDMETREIQSSPPF